MVKWLLENWVMIPAGDSTSEKWDSGFRSHHTASPIKSNVWIKTWAWQWLILQCHLITSSFSSLPGNLGCCRFRKQARGRMLSVRWCNTDYMTAGRLPPGYFGFFTQWTQKAKQELFYYTALTDTNVLGGNLLVSMWWRPEDSLDQGHHLSATNIRVRENGNDLK